jgi:hypothetical protein
MLEKIVGMVFPFPHKTVDRLLSKERDVVSKFGRFLHLSKGQRLQFYDSDVHAIVGEAKIEKVVHMDPMNVWETYGQRLFLNQDEFDKYISRTPLGPRDLKTPGSKRTPPKKKVMTVCVLSDPKKFQHPKKPTRKMNMIGHYLRE